VLPDGTVFILDLLNNRVCKVTPDGFLTTLFEDPGGFGPGRGLWVSPGGDLAYYAGPRSVKRWTPSGGTEVATDGLVDPGNLTIDPDGQLVVTDRGAHRVYRVGADGSRTTIAGNGATGGGTDGVLATACALDEVRGVAFLPDGGYFLATMKGGDIWYVDTNGLIHLFVPGTGSGNVHAGDGQPVTTPGDKISEPRAVTVAPNGDVLITCNDTGFVRAVNRLPTVVPDVEVDFTRGSPSSFGLRWTTAEGQSYTVEASGALDGWMTVGPPPTLHPDGTAEWTDPDPVSGARNYRLRTE
jgi:WD40 repeat protein